jgi:flagellar hook protein FlgE
MTIYASLSGLRAAQTDLDVIANNLANSETTGFKKSTVNFADVVVNSVFSTANSANGVGVRVDKIDQNFAIGPVDQTGNALDLAIGGDGFFSVVSPQSGQTVFTRDGHFSADSAGKIIDSDGNQLQMLTTAGGTPSAAQVALTNAAGSGLAGVTVGTDGTIAATYQDASSIAVGQVALASFATPTGLKPIGSANWTATGLSGAPTYGVPGSGSVGGLLTGSLEQSNVDVSNELVNLITAQRYFQANAKAVDTANTITETIINLRN